MKSQEWRAVQISLELDLTPTGYNIRIIENSSGYIINAYDLSESVAAFAPSLQEGDISMFEVGAKTTESYLNIRRTNIA